MERKIRHRGIFTRRAGAIALGLSLGVAASFGAQAEVGVSKDKIVIGGVMDLEGRSRAPPGHVENRFSGSERNFAQSSSWRNQHATPA